MVLLRHPPLDKIRASANESRNEHAHCCCIDGTHLYYATCFALAIALQKPNSSLVLN